MKGKYSKPIELSDEEFLTQFELLEANNPEEDHEIKRHMLIFKIVFYNPFIQTIFYNLICFFFFYSHSSKLEYSILGVS